MKTKLIEIIKLWLIAGIIVAALSVLIATMDDLNDRTIDESVKKETISQAIEENKREAMALRAKKIELAERAEYMTGFAVVQR